MTEWKQGEDGPDCTCGNPTAVMVDEDGVASLLCLLHTRGEGAIYPLPRERPEKWPDMTNAEMKALVDKGFEEDPE